MRRSKSSFWHLGPAGFDPDCTDGGVMRLGGVMRRDGMMQLGVNIATRSRARQLMCDVLLLTRVPRRALHCSHKRPALILAVLCPWEPLLLGFRLCLSDSSSRIDEIDVAARADSAES